MKEKSKNIIIIILIVIIIIMGGLLLFLEKDKLFGSKANNQTTEETPENNDDNMMSEEEALALGNELWNFADGTYFAASTIWKSHYEDNPNGPGQIKVCDADVNEIKAKFSPDFQWALYTDDGQMGTGTMDSFIYSSCPEFGRGTLQNYMDSKLSNPVIGEDEISYTVTIEYCSSSFCKNGKEVDHTNLADFKIKKINGEWLISYFPITR